MAGADDWVVGAAPKAPAPVLDATKPTTPDGDWVVGQDPSAPQQSYVAGLARAVGQGVSMNWSDELLGRLRGLSGEDQAAAIADERAKLASFKKQNPKTAIAAELGGAFLTPGIGAASGLIRGGTGLARSIGRGAAVGGGVGAISGAGAAADGDGLSGAAKGGALGAVLGGGLTGGLELARGVRSAAAGVGQTGAYNQFAKQLPEGGIDTFANQIATGATRTDQTIQRRTLDILGQEMERAGGNRGQAQASAIARIQAETGASLSAAQAQIRRLTGAQNNSTLLLSEYPAAAASNAAIRSHRNPANVSAAEAGMIHDSGAQKILDDLANGAGAQSSSTVRNAVTERNLGSRDAMRGALDNLAPRAPGSNAARSITDLDQMQDGARRAAAAEYAAAYAPGNTNNQLLVGLLPRIIDRHVNRMAGRSGDQAQALQKAVNEFRIQTPQGQTLNMMTMQQLQDARGSLRGQIEVARRAGQNHIAATLQPLYKDVTRLMERSNPTWANANRRWADNSIDTRARELGEAFSTKAGPQYRRQLGEYQRLAPEAQQMVQVEYLQKLADKLDNVGDTHDVAKLFTNDHTRNAITSLFGHEGNIAVAQMVRDLGIATKSGRMLGGSQTAQRLARAQDGNIETGILAAAEGASVNGAKNWLIQRMLSLMTEQRNRPLAQIATTPMRDTAEVARHIHNMRVAQQYKERIAQPNSMGLLMSAPAAQELSGAVNQPPRLSAPAR